MLYTYSNFEIQRKCFKRVKEKFKEYNILTVHGIIVTNALIFMHKFHHFPNSTFSLKLFLSLVIGDNINGCGSWVDKYNTITFRRSFFYKEPL